MHARALRRLLIVLSTATIVALLWNEFGMDTTRVIDARSPAVLSAVDDHGAPGGGSVASVSRERGALELGCQVAAGVDRPSCEMRLALGSEPGGVDLGRYDGVRLWISASGPEAQQRVRVTVRNFNPGYSKPGVLESQKVQQIVYEPSAYASGYEVPLSRFTVDAAWLEAHPLAFDLSAPDFRNVTTLGFATGPALEPGLHRISVDRIELVGKLVPASTMRLGIIAAWLLAVAGYFAIDSLSARNQLRLSAASQHSLQRLNESLRLETRSLAEIARTDPLTGVLNRKGLADELMRLVRMSGDACFPLTLVFIDIDHFRRLNEAHGHAVGDQVIRGLTDLVRSAVQREDLFARWGGEEFLLVFRDTPGAEGAAIAERVRERIATGHWPGEAHVTCSFGVAEWHRGEDLGEGIRRADEAMYRAKQNGRDRVEIELETEPHRDSETQPA